MKRSLLFVVVSLVMAVPAMADPVSLTFNGVVGSQTIKLTDDDYGNHYVYVGVSDIDVSGAGSGIDGDGIASFCIDLADSVNSGDTYAVNVAPLDACPDPASANMGDSKASQVAWLLDNSFSGTGGYSLGMSAVDGAALQLAVWEVINEDTSSYDVSAGSFQATSNDGVKTAAQTLLDELTDGWSSGYSFVSYAGLTSPVPGISGEYQDFVVKVVPLPGAILLGFLGFGTAGLKLRRMVG